MECLFSNTPTKREEAIQISEAINTIDKRCYSASNTKARHTPSKKKNNTFIRERKTQYITKIGTQTPSILSISFEKKSSSPPNMKGMHCIIRNIKTIKTMQPHEHSFKRLNSKTIDSAANKTAYPIQNAKLFFHSDKKYEKSQAFINSYGYCAYKRPTFLHSQSFKNLERAKTSHSATKTNNLIPSTSTICIAQFLNQLNSECTHTIMPWKEDIKYPSHALNSLSKIYRLPIPKIQKIIYQYHQLSNFKLPTEVSEALKCAKIQKIPGHRIIDTLFGPLKSRFKNKILETIGISLVSNEKMYNFDEYMRFYKFAHPKMLNTDERSNFVNKLIFRNCSDMISQKDLIIKMAVILRNDSNACELALRSLRSYLNKGKQLVPVCIIKRMIKEDKILADSLFTSIFS